jgi:hypothetical protein
MNPVDFSNNLFLSCKNNSRIREDGKALTIFDRISDFFHGRHGYEHFLSMCDRCSQDSFVEKIKCLPKEEQIEILGRISQIQKKITNQTAKQQCDSYIQTVESNLLSKNVDEYSDVLFKKILSDAKNKKFKPDNHIRNLEELIQFFSHDEESISKILLKFSDYLNETQSYPTEKQKQFFHVVNEKIVNILIFQEEKILKNNNINENHYNSYPILFRLKLENDFRNLNKQEVYNSICNLKTLMDKHSDNVVFVKNCLQQIDQFLGNSLFHSKMHFSLSEMKKNDLLAFRDFFTIIDTYLPVISDSDRQLAVDLKIKCANLPCPKVRPSFPNLFLSEKDQLDILIEGLQKKEDEATKQLSEFLKTNNPSISDISRLTKLVSIKSGLNDENRLKIRTALEVRLKDQSPKDWEDYRDVNARLENIFLLEPGTTPHIDSLKRICKSKLFFKNQLDLDENMIIIPRWYHATHRYGINGILTSGEIQVRHEKAFRGAWISTAREQGFGSYALSLSNKITDLDPSVFIGYQYEDRRWRGIQKAIPLKNDENISHLAIVGVPSQLDKMAKKTDKLKLIKILKEKGFPDPKAVSVTQLDFIQKEVMSILGTPNLSDQWWGSGRSYSEHQVKLHSQIQSMPIESSLFKVGEDSSNQVAIGQVIQSVALPLYKEPMPQTPSYRSDVTSVRVELGNKGDDGYKRHVDKVHKQLVPSRGHHGTMHCVRVALWTQLLSKVYEKLGKEKIKNPILLATAGAFHDVAREEEGIDYWDTESSEALEKLLGRIEVGEQGQEYIQAIKDKDPKNGKFSSDTQRIVHDADCLDIIRVVGKWNFSKKYLCFYNFDPKQKSFCDQLVNEIGDFIEMTEKFEVRNYLEHHSEDFYGDLVRLIFLMKKKEKSRFPIITEILQHDMENILKVKSTPVTEHLLSILQ